MEDARAYMKLDTSDLAELPKGVRRTKFFSLEGFLFPIEPINQGNKAYSFARFDADSYVFEPVFCLEIGLDIIPEARIIAPIILYNEGTLPPRNSAELSIFWEENYW